MVQRDPYSAMEWAKAVETEARRTQAVREIFTLWHARNAAEANEALDSNGLRQETIDEIRQAVEQTAPVEN